MSLQGNGQCQDKSLRRGKFWEDKMHFNCSLYVGAKWCKKGGSGYGKGWNSFWGKFRGFKNKGMDASNACCGCGGGIKKAKRFDDTLPIYTGVVEYPYADVSCQFHKILLTKATIKQNHTYNCIFCTITVKNNH